MKTSSLITRAVIVTGFLAAVAVPAANAVSDNTPNYGNSGKSVADPSPAASNNENNGNAFGNGGRGTWGGCRGVHGNDNPGQGVGPVANKGNANGHDKPWKDCGGGTPDPDEDVEGSNYTLPVTR